MKLKKAMAVVLSFLLLLGTQVSAFAASSYDLTINNLKGATQIKLYRVITIEDSSGKLTYNLNNEYGAVFTDLGITKVGELEEKQVKDILESCRTKITSDTDADVTKDITGAADTAVFENLDMGYYYITMAGEAGTIYNPMLVVVPDSDTEASGYKDTVVTAKANKPVAEKEILEGQSWGEKADAGIGDEVKFKITADVTKYSDNVKDEDVTFTLSDTLSEGLTWITGQTVTVKDESGSTITGALKAGNPTVAAEGTKTKVTFDLDYSKIKDKTSVVLEYSAIVNENAAVGTAGNENLITLKYTTDPWSNTTVDSDTDKTTLYTYGLDVTKAELGNVNITLPGAMFTLKQGETQYYFKADGAGYTAFSSDVYTFTKYGDTYKGTPKYAGLPELTGLVEKVVSGTDGKIYIKGLDAGEYTLTETDPPEGYYIVTQNIEFTITGDKANEQLTGNVALGGDTGNEATTADGSYHMTVFNSTEYVLPKTGDMGTAILIAGGTVMIAAACIMLVLYTRRRKAE